MGEPVIGSAEGSMDVQVLSVDVGVFTQDILLWTGSYEMSFKLILPSPTQIIAGKVRRATAEGMDLSIVGETMGGGPVNRALRSHLEKGCSITMTERSARTIRDDLDRVRAMGVSIVSEDEARALSERPRTVCLETKDLDTEAISRVVSGFGLALEPEVVAVGVEDHGTPTGSHGTPTEMATAEGSRAEEEAPLSDREVRFDHFKDILPATSDGFGYSDPPSHYTRMSAVKRTMDADFPDARHLVMDSKIAALFGSASTVDRRCVLAADVGNGHITVGSLEGGELTGLFEHHTRLLTKDRVEGLIQRFTEGRLTHREVFEDGGHGCHIVVPIGEAQVLVSGPRRTDLFTEAPPDVVFANPYGDVMITGNVGLTECARSRYGLQP